MDPLRVARRKLLLWGLPVTIAILLGLLLPIWEITRYLIGESVAEYRYKQITICMALSESRSRLGAGQEWESCPHTREVPVVEGSRFY
jgi:hypothetical protein